MRSSAWLTLILAALIAIPVTSIAAPKPTAGSLKKILIDDQGRKFYLDKKTIAKDDQGILHYWVKIVYPDTVPMTFEGKKVAYMLQHRTQHCEKSALSPSDLEYYFDSRHNEVGTVDASKSTGGVGKMSTPKAGTTEAKMFTYVCERYSHLTSHHTDPQD